jgi:hypothetical protein
MTTNNIAKMLSHMSVPQIRDTFNIVGDFTEEEEREVILIRFFFYTRTSVTSRIVKLAAERWTHRQNGTVFEARLDHKRRSGFERLIDSPCDYIIKFS